MTKNTKKGFTLVELMFAVLFIGTLLLAIAMLTIQLLNIYTKGMVMRSVNSTGNDIADDIRSAIQESTLFSAGSINPRVAKKSGNGQADVYSKEVIDEVKKNYFVMNDDHTYGAFCTNSYTYIFNLRDAMVKYRSGEKNEIGDTKYLTVKTGDTTRPYGLIRFYDGGATFCRSASAMSLEAMDGKDLGDSGKYSILLDGKTEDENTDLQLYDFYVHHATMDSNSSQALFNISFVLGTTRGGIDINSSSNYCGGAKEEAKKEAEEMDDYEKLDYDYDDTAINYCSVNRFEFTVRQTATPQNQR